jgi:hypothetical protein
MSNPVTLEDIFQIFERAQAEADRRHAELEKLVTVANNAVNNLTSRWGRFVENLVEPAAVRLFQERGIDVKYY